MTVTHDLDPGWTTERVQEAVRLWQEGRSASYIADALGHLTRSAVIGKLYRMGLLGNGRKADRTMTSRTVTRGDGKKVTRFNKGNRVGQRFNPGSGRYVTGLSWNDLPLPPEPAPTQNSRWVALDALQSGECRFPRGSDVPYEFCGCAAVPGASYCNEHLALAYSLYRPKRAQDLAETNHKIRAAMRVADEGVE